MFLLRKETIDLTSYILTIGKPLSTLEEKIKRKHAPKNKILGKCSVSDTCTDTTGKHHCLLVHSTSLEGVYEIMNKRFNGVHITRIELGRFYS